MAQDFVGSNNVHLLSPNGQFGTRLMGGKDAASPRYIFTNLEQVSRILFDPLDNDVLNYLDDDGQSIEPEWYIPIIPMALVNGSEGIGTGWSSSVPNYNPHDIILNLRQKLKNEELSPLVPWYRGFSGQIVEKSTGKPSDNQNFSVQGLYELKDESTLVISELPVKSWTQTYKQFLESLLETGTIKDFRENHTDVKVSFTIIFEPKILSDICKAPGGVVKKFKLEASISTSNMHLFDAQGRIKKYENPHQILEEFYTIRLDYYGRRKAALLRKLEDQIKTLSNKARFVLAVVNQELVVSNRKKQDILQQLMDDGYDQIVAKASKAKKIGDDADEEEEEEDNASDASRGYDYLLSMKILSLTKERVEKLRAELQAREDEHRELDGTPIETLWIRDLDKLEALLLEHEAERARIAASAPTPKKNTKGRRPSAKAKKGKKKGDSDDDSDYETSKAKPKARAAPKPATSKPAAPKPAVKEAKPRPITSFFAAKEPEKPKPVKEEEEEVLSLAERLARRGQTTPKKDASSKPAKKAQKKVVELANSDDEAVVIKDEEESDDDDVFALNIDDKKTKKPAAKANGKAKAAAKPAAARAKSTTTAAKAKKAAGDDDDDDSSPNSPVKAKGKFLTLPTLIETMSSSFIFVVLVAAPKRPIEKTKAAPAPKKQKRAAVDSDEDDDEENDDAKSSPVVSARRPTRTKARITYTEILSDEEEEEEEEEAHASSGLSEVDDNESDFE